MAQRKKTQRKAPPSPKPQFAVRFKRGTRIPPGVDKSDAMQALLNYSHRHISAEQVYEEVSSNTLHPLYNWYEWDPDKAMHAHHMSQTRQMLRSVEFVIEYEPAGEIVVSAMTSVHDKATGKRVYTSTLDAMNDPEYREQILLSAMNELRRFQAKYRNLSELAQVMATIKQVLTQDTVKARATRAKKRSQHKAS